MFGSVQRHKYRDPLRKLFYGVIGNPRIGELERAWRVLRAVRALQLPAAPQILDAGCGEGSYSLWLSQRYPDGMVTAADTHQQTLDDVNVLAAQAGRTNIKITTLDLEHLDAVSEYDLIICVDVMEHIENHQRVMANLHRALRPGGHLVLHVPQPQQRFLFVRRTFGPGHPHVREGYTPVELERLLRGQGFAVVASEQSFGSLATLACEVDEILWTSKLYPVWLAMYPLLLLVGSWDISRPVRHGHGVLMVARQ